jgi:site-specific DNA-cytosine methylase
VNRDCLTLFAGGGIADCGIHAAGWRTVGAVEWDPAIAAVFAENHGLAPLVAGVETVDYRPFAGVDAVWSSPCCTNASVAKANGEEAPEDLSAAEAVCRCLREVRPRVFALENVWGYRNFRAFSLILRELEALGYAFLYEHLNSADYGVPQARRRLILRARRDGLPVLPLPPTHAEYRPGGGLFGDEEAGCLPPWNGWYAAVEDLLPECPPSQFAAWQLARLPSELRETVLVDVNNASRDHTRRPVAEPAMSVAANFGHRPANMPRALLVHGTSTLETRAAAGSAACVVGTVSAKAARPRAFLARVQGEGSEQLAEGAGHAPSIAANHAAGKYRAFLVDARQGRNADEEPPTARAGEEPVWSLAATSGGDRYRAFLVDGQESGSESELVIRRAEEPAYTASAGTGTRRPARASLEQGRVVSLTPRCLARFQSIPDTYRLPERNALACRVIGNGAPSLLVQRVMESLR